MFNFSIWKIRYKGDKSIMWSQEEKRGGFISEEQGKSLLLRPIRWFGRPLLHRSVCSSVSRVLIVSANGISSNADIIRQCESRTIGGTSDVVYTELVLVVDRFVFSFEGG